MIVDKLEGFSNYALSISSEDLREQLHGEISGVIEVYITETAKHFRKMLAVCIEAAHKKRARTRVAPGGGQGQGRPGPPPRPGGLRGRGPARGPAPFPPQSPPRARDIRRRPPRAVAPPEAEVAARLPRGRLGARLP